MGTIEYLCGDVIRKLSRIMACCGYVGFLFVGIVMALVSGLAGGLVGVMTRPAAGAIVAVVINALLVGMLFGVMVKATPESPPEVPDLKENAIRSLIWLCGLLFIGGSILGAMVAYGTAKRKRVG